MRRKSWVREKRTVCGKNYMEVDIMPVTEREHLDRRRRKEKPSSDAQKNLNDRRAKRYFIQLVNTNFHARDLRVDLTYNDEHLPATPEEAEHRFELWRRKVLRYAAREGWPRPKWTCVTESGKNSKGKAVRIHHHVLISGYLDRDALEKLWCTGRGKAAKPLGIVRTERLQPQGGTLTAIAAYMLKSAARKRRWRSSLNLEQPQTPPPNDTKYTRAKLARLVQGYIYDGEWWAKQYTGWDLIESSAEYNELTGWAVTAKLRRRVPEPPPPWPKRKAVKHGNPAGRSRTSSQGTG